jgi:hypothetical protein
MMTIHPDDILLYTEVVGAMRRVAAKYGLPLRNITGYPMPEAGMADRMGDCSSTGDIRLVLRCTVNGAWCEMPLSPEEVWDTAAHELAHLKHLNHGLEFQDFYEELKFAMRNQQKDHRSKILDKLVKLQTQRDDAATRASNKGFDADEAAREAQAFAGMINRMLIEHELNPSDIDYARANNNDPVIEIMWTAEKVGAKKTKTRVAWQETLAGQVADAHLCRILVNGHSNNIWFVGTRSHATVAEYVFGTMVPLIDKMSKRAELDYWKATGCGRGADNKALGYRAAWIDAFIKRIWERFQEARKAAMDAYLATAGATTETGLMRLDGSLIKVRQYIEDKFSSSSRAAKSIRALQNRGGRHEHGRAAGRAAADSITLGSRAITGGADRKKLS